MKGSKPTALERSGKRRRPKWKGKAPFCVICHQTIDVQEHGWTTGHNAKPVAEGRCCTRCNDEVVVPARLANILGNLAKS